MYHGTRKELLEHAFKPYPSPHRTAAWPVMEQALMSGLHENIASVIFSCMSKILSPISSCRTYLNLDEQNVVLVRKDDADLPLPCDVGMRTTRGKLTLCYMTGVHMCDIDLPNTRFSELSAEQLEYARRVLFEIVVSIARHYDDVVDASTATAVQTPHGMHIYFVTGSRRPSAERLIEFMRQTNDSKYVTSFVLDPDRGFCDKVYQIYESGNPLESPAMDGSHVAFAISYDKYSLGIVNPTSELHSLLELRKRVAEYAYHTYRDVDYADLHGSIFIDILTDPSVTPLDVYNHRSDFVEGYMHDMAKVICKLRHTYGIVNTERIARALVELCKEDWGDFHVNHQVEDEITIYFRKRMEHVMRGILSPQNAAMNFLVTMLNHEDIRRKVHEVHKREAFSRRSDLGTLCNWHDRNLIQKFDQTVMRLCGTSPDVTIVKEPIEGDDTDATILGKRLRGDETEDTRALRNSPHSFGSTST